MQGCGRTISLQSYLQITSDLGSLNLEWHFNQKVDLVYNTPPQDLEYAVWVLITFLSEDLARIMVENRSVSKAAIHAVEAYVTRCDVY